MHAGDYQLETQISGIACVNDTNLNLENTKVTRVYSFLKKTST